MIQNITDLSRKMRNGKLRSRDLIEESFASIDADGAEGAKVFLSIYTDAARAQADWVDSGRQAGVSLPPHAGIPIAIKDLFDVQGEVTRAGSRVLDEHGPANQDADIVMNLRRAGFVIVGKNNMTEFAYSGLGVNAHFGTPANPGDSQTPRVPGGSSSGAAVAVKRQMVPAAIGTDTGGSCRIPAAFCGTIGFKPTSTRVSNRGAIPLSQTLDCVGPLTTSVSCAAVLDSVLSGGHGDDVESFPEGGLRLGVLDGYVTEEMDEVVAGAYQDALTRLSRRGVRLTPLELPQLARLPAINSKGGFVGADAYAWHKDLLETRADFYDPWVRDRFGAGKSQTAADYIAVGRERKHLQALVDAKQEPFDALILPTVQIVPPTLNELKDQDHANAVNLLCLRNTAVGNFLDLPAISIPCHAEGSLPVGLMLFGVRGHDRRLLSVARGLEQVIRGR
ncbi:MAG: amidase [Aestuariivita sp.]|nr:amidase [Aestuariivita sp.]MCY4348037.1 amidase [Aestuariivita sp.]